MRWMLGGDVNQDWEDVRRLLDAPHAFGHDPVGLYWSTGWKGAAAGLALYRQHTDHRVLRLMAGRTTVAVVNMTWQWGGDQALLRGVARWADVILLVECRTRSNQPLPIRQMIGDTHRVRQDTTTAARAGSAIAVRKSPDLIITGSSLTQLSPQAPGVQWRGLRTVNVRDHGVLTRYGAAHLALRGTGVQDDGERALQAWVARARRHRPT